MQYNAGMLLCRDVAVPVVKCWRVKAVDMLPDALMLFTIRSLATKV